MALGNGDMDCVKQHNYRFKVEFIQNSYNWNKPIPEQTRFYRSKTYALRYGLKQYNFYYVRGLDVSVQVIDMIENKIVWRRN